MQTFSPLQFLLILIAVFLIGSCKQSQTRIVARFKDGTPSLIYEIPDNRDTSSYTYLEFYPNGKIHKKLEVESNRIVNHPTIYYPSGKIYELDSLLEPRGRHSSSWNGWIVRFAESGNKIAEFEVKNGHILNTKMFDSAGNLTKQYFVVRDTIKDGPYSEYYPNGVISVKASFRNDTLVGMMYFFNDKGDTERYYYRDQGRISMPYKKWLDSGDILTGEFTSKNEKSVLWKWYTKDGKEIKRVTQYSKNREFVVPE